MVTFVGDIVRWGVWLGRYACYKLTQVSYDELNENRNLVWSRRAKASFDFDVQYAYKL